jgi:hypothetical protein
VPRHGSGFVHRASCRDLSVKINIKQVLQIITATTEINFCQERSCWLWSRKRGQKKASRGVNRPISMLSIITLIESMKMYPNYPIGFSAKSPPSCSIFIVIVPGVTEHIHGFAVGVSAGHFSSFYLGFKQKLPNTPLPHSELLFNY